MAHDSDSALRVTTSNGSNVGNDVHTPTLISPPDSKTPPTIINMRRTMAEEMAARSRWMRMLCQKRWRSLSKLADKENTRQARARAGSGRGYMETGELRRRSGVGNEPYLICLQVYTEPIRTGSAGFIQLAARRRFARNAFESKTTDIPQRAQLSAK